MWRGATVLGGLAGTGLSGVRWYSKHGSYQFLPHTHKKKKAVLLPLLLLLFFFLFFSSCFLLFYSSFFPSLD